MWQYSALGTTVAIVALLVLASVLIGGDARPWLDRRCGPRRHRRVDRHALGDPAALPPLVLPPGPGCPRAGSRRGHPAILDGAVPAGAAHRPHRRPARPPPRPDHPGDPHRLGHHRRSPSRHRRRRGRTVALHDPPPRRPRPTPSDGARHDHPVPPTRHGPARRRRGDPRRTIRSPPPRPSAAPGLHRVRRPRRRPARPRVRRDPRPLHRMVVAAHRRTAAGPGQLHPPMVAHDLVGRRRPCGRRPGGGATHPPRAPDRPHPADRGDPDLPSPGARRGHPADRGRRRRARRRGRPPPLDERRHEHPLGTAGPTRPDDPGRPRAARPDRRVGPGR